MPNSVSVSFGCQKSSFEDMSFPKEEWRLINRR